MKAKKRQNEWIKEEKTTKKGKKSTQIETVAKHKVKRCSKVEKHYDDHIKSVYFGIPCQLDAKRYLVLDENERRVKNKRKKEEKKNRWETWLTTNESIKWNRVFFVSPSSYAHTDSDTSLRKISVLF